MKASKEEKAKSLTKLLKLEIKSKNFMVKDVAERWGVTPRRMSQILKNPSYMHIDAIYGLPSNTIIS